MKSEYDLNEQKDQEQTSEKIGRCFALEKNVKNLGRKERIRSGKEVLAKLKDGDLLHYYIELLESEDTLIELVDDDENPISEVSGGALIALELIGKDGEPTGKLIEGISKEEFGEKFVTCSEHECTLQTSTVDEIAKKMAENRAVMGEKHLKNGELNQAEDKFKRALIFDENSVSASLGLGKTKLEQEKIDEAMEIFNNLSKNNAIYDHANKHTFNDFGIYLRKKGLYDLAINNYEKAIVIDPEDEVLFFNLGRAYGDKGEAHTAIEKMKEALKIAGAKKPDNVDEIDQIKLIIKHSEKHIKLFLEKEKELLDNLFKEQELSENDDYNNQTTQTNL